MPCSKLEIWSSNPAIFPYTQIFSPITLEKTSTLKVMDSLKRRQLVVLKFCYMEVWADAKYSQIVEILLGLSTAVSSVLKSLLSAYLTLTKNMHCSIKGYSIVIIHKIIIQVNRTKKKQGKHKTEYSSRLFYWDHHLCTYCKNVQDFEAKR